MPLIKKLTLMLIVLSGVVACQQKKNTNTPSINITELPDQEGWNSSLTATTDGIVVATIQYGHMMHYNKKKVAYFDGGVVVDFYDKNGKHSSRLTSDRGRLDEKTNNVEAIDNVIVISDSGITLQTEKLWWDDALAKVITDRFVTITTVDRDTIYGVGFESDQTLARWQLNEVRGKSDKKFELNLKPQKSTAADSIPKEQ